MHYSALTAARSSSWPHPTRKKISREHHHHDQREHQTQASPHFTLEPTPIKQSIPPSRDVVVVCMWMCVVPGSLVGREPVAVPDCAWMIECECSEPADDRTCAPHFRGRAACVTLGQRARPRGQSLVSHCRTATGAMARGKAGNRHIPAKRET